MARQKSKPIKLSGTEKGGLIFSSLFILGTFPITYIFFLIPVIAGLPIVMLAILVITGIIRNPIAVRIVQVITISGALLNAWLLGMMLNWQTEGFVNR